MARCPNHLSWLLLMQMSSSFTPRPLPDVLHPISKAKPRPLAKGNWFPPRASTAFTFGPLPRVQVRGWGLDRDKPVNLHHYCITKDAAPDHLHLPGLRFQGADPRLSGFTLSCEAGLPGLAPGGCPCPQARFSSTSMPLPSDPSPEMPWVSLPWAFCPQHSSRDHRSKNIKKQQQPSAVVSWNWHF